MERASKRRSIIIATGILLLACWPCAFALDPSLDVNQYAHTVWKLSEGFSKGNIWSIAQTTDGYLWLGTEFGLLRFDGVRAVPWHPPGGEHLPSSDVTSVRVTRDGALWIGTSGGLVRWKDGNLTHYQAFNGLIIEALLEDREGTIWVIAGRALPESRLCSVQKEKTHCYGEDGGAGFGITSMYEDSRGLLWAGGMKGVWRWNPGPPQFYPMAGPEERTYALTESDDGGILISRRSGITKLRNGRFERYPFPVGLRFAPSKLLRDRDGGLWIGALVDQGLLHIHQGKTDLFTSAEGVFGDLSGHQVRCFFEDREGSIWVSTPSGLDRFREFAIPTVSVPQGLSSRGISSVLAGKDGSIWLATSDGLNRWNGGRVDVYRHRSGPLSSTWGGFTTGQFAEPGTTTHEIVDAGFPPQEVNSLFEDEDGRIWVSTLGGVAFSESNRFVPVRSVPPGNVFSIIGDRAENVWMGHQEGLFHLQRARLVERISWAKFGRKEPASALLHDAVRGGLWIGFREGGVAFFKGGQLRASYAGPQGLAEGIVHSFYKDGSGFIWTATEGGLSRIENNRVLTLTSKNGLPCNNVHWMMEDDVDSVWLYTACGLVRMPRSELDAWVSGSKYVTQLTVFDISDGVGIHPNISRESPVVTKARDGRIWFITLGGVSIIDPHHLAFNKLPPPVRIEQVTADDKTYDATNGLRLPPHVRYLAIDYTALSFVAPEKVSFRYKLEGEDKDWREVANDRNVQYTNLAPKHYRFRVLACNNSGVWNETGDTLEFVIPPAWYQTRWFYALCAATFLLMLWGLYRLRVLQLQREFNATLEGRVAERTRVARDLHDTLLQSFHGLLLRFGIVDKLLPGRAEDAKKELQKAMELATAAITEGRDAVQGLRDSVVQGNDLARAISTLGEDLVNQATKLRPTFRVTVQGESRELHPIIRDEIYKVAAEALRNTVRHADAKHVEVEIQYDNDRFRLRVRDDGRGIDPEVLASDGRERHYGLPGMRERATLIGGKLEIWSKLDAGTELELTIPAKRAYAKSWRRSWLTFRSSEKEDSSKAAGVESECRPR